LVTLYACTKEDPTIVIADDFTVTIDENPAFGTELGAVSASTSDGSALTYSIINSGSLRIDENTGVITVTDPREYDFEVNPIVTAEYVATSGGVSANGKITINLNDDTGETFASKATSSSFGVQDVANNPVSITLDNPHPTSSYKAVFTGLYTESGNTIEVSLTRSGNNLRLPSSVNLLYDIYTAEIIEEATGVKIAVLNDNQKQEYYNSNATGFYSQLYLQDPDNTSLSTDTLSKDTPLEVRTEYPFDDPQGKIYFYETIGGDAVASLDFGTGSVAFGFVISMRNASLPNSLIAGRRYFMRYESRSINKNSTYDSFYLK